MLKVYCLTQVILEDLPKEFAEALQSYNAQVTKVFSQYLTTVATEQERQRGEENKLPLSGIGKRRQQMATARHYVNLCWAVTSMDFYFYTCVKNTSWRCSELVVWRRSFI